MKHIQFLLLLLIIIGFACKKEETKLAFSLGEIGRICLNLKNEFKEKPVLSVNLITRYFNGSDYHENMANATAYGSTDTTDALIVNGISIPYKRVLRGATLFSSRPNKPTNEAYNRDDLYLMFGHNVPLRFGSQALGNFVDSLKTSKTIELKVNDTIYKSLHTFSLSKTLKLTWNKDTSSKNPVLITLMKLPFTSSFFNKPIQVDTAEILLQIQKRVDDNGFFELTPYDLAIFPKKSMIDVSIMRGSYNLVKTSKGKPVLLNAVSQYSMMLEVE